MPYGDDGGAIRAIVSERRRDSFEHRPCIEASRRPEKVVKREVVVTDCNCPICFEPYNKTNWGVFECGHLCCMRCTEGWFKARSDLFEPPTCPLCRFGANQVVGGITYLRNRIAYYPCSRFSFVEQNILWTRILELVPSSFAPPSPISPMLLVLASSAPPPPISAERSPVFLPPALPSRFVPSTSPMPPPLSTPCPRIFWEPNVSHCPICVKPFSFTRRRHHCRTCGRLICTDCGSKGHFLSFESRQCVSCRP